MMEEIQQKSSSLSSSDVITTTPSTTTISSLLRSLSSTTTTTTTRLSNNPLLRKYDLNETHTRYDYATSVPSDSQLKLQFILLATINIIVAISCFILLSSILKSKTVSSNPFNLYLLFIIIPDFIASFNCFLTCAMSAPSSTYYSEAMCGYQSFYLAFGFTANCWMNGVIVHQLHKMLRLSNIRSHYNPPTRKYVIWQATIVYIYATLLALVGVWNIRWLPHKTGTYHGFACFPMEYDLPSTLVYWLVFIPAFLFAPVIYAIWVGIDIWRRNLLPPIGRRRTLVLYFIRLIIVYLFMWFPFLVICTIGNNTPLGSWTFWIGAAWSHLQGLISVILSTTKKDIKEALLSFICCREERVPESTIFRPGRGSGSRGRRTGRRSSSQQEQEQQAEQGEGEPISRRCRNSDTYAVVYEPRSSSSSTRLQSRNGRTSISRLFLANMFSSRSIRRPFKNNYGDDDNNNIDDDDNEVCAVVDGDDNNNNNNPLAVTGTTTTRPSNCHQTTTPTISMSLRRLFSSNNNGRSYDGQQLQQQHQNSAYAAKNNFYNIGTSVIAEEPPHDVAKRIDYDHQYVSHTSHTQYPTSSVVIDPSSVYTDKEEEGEEEVTEETTTMTRSNDDNNTSSNKCCDITENGNKDNKDKDDDDDDLSLR